jgi:RNA polymerase sigma-70 factor (ECF subfamily)
VTDDEALIRAAQAGDGTAFERLLERHYDTLYRFAYKWCGSRMDAEDVTQQACLKLAHGLDQYRFESALTSWLYRVVVNCAKDWARSQGRHAVAAPEPHEDNPDSATSAEDVVEHQAFLWQLLHRLDALPEGIKETLLLVHAEGLTHGEAAAVLQIKESTVSWRLHEFRKHYRLAFEGGGTRDG